VYKLGSVSKQYLAATVMMLVEEGALSVEEPVRTFIPAAPVGWASIRLRHLLSHTSGLASESPAFDAYYPCALEKMVHAAFDVPLTAPPGQRWSYSNLGYFVVALVLEIVTKRAFDALLKERLFDRWKLTSTRASNVYEVIEHRANSYLLRNATLHNAGDLNTLRPSGAFVSNVTDLLEWVRVLDEDRALSPRSRTEMEKPAQLEDGTPVPYGYGWHTGSVAGRRFVRHGGGLWCFRVELLRFPDECLTVAVLMNAQHADAAAIAGQIAAAVLPGLPPNTLAFRMDESAIPRPVEPTTA
jgi:CubicO group peptidase (beta-lactamase class C family)